MGQPRAFARYILLLSGLVGEVLFAGAIFGWNALSLMLKKEELYAAGCGDADKCSSQDTRLAVVWTAGVFAVNFGSVLGGPSLDYLGPRVTCTAGALQASVGLLLLSFGFSSPKVLFPLGAFLLSLGGLSFHMSQFHIAQLFPSNKGLVSSLFVGGFIASGFTFEVLRQIYNAAGGADDTNHATYNTILLVHACLCIPSVLASLWMTPKATLKGGDRYHLNGLSFIVTPQSQEAVGPESSPLEGREPLTEPADPPDSTEVHKDLHRSDHDVPESPTGEGARVCAEKGQNLQADCGHERIRRWAVLARKPFTQQLKAPEFFALGLFFALNVLVLQFYLGTARIQLEELSASRFGLYVQLLSFIVPGIFVLAPFNGYILDKLGYGFVLIVINSLSLSAVVLQSIPVVQLQLAFPLVREKLFVAVSTMDSCWVKQVVMFVAWAAARYLLYSSFFTIVGSIFSYQSFGRIFGVISVTAGLLGLLQLPLTDLSINGLDRNFLPLQIAAGVIVVLLYWPAILMFRWERQ